MSPTFPFPWDGLPLPVDMSGELNWQNRAA